MNMNNLAHRLKLSTLTPGCYQPSESVKTGKHAAVLLGSIPVILCGPSEDYDSIELASKLSQSSRLQALFSLYGLSGAISNGVCNGRDIVWKDCCSAIVAKNTGLVEDGSESGPLISIILEDQNNAIATACCTDQEISRIFDPSCPDL